MRNSWILCKVFYAIYEVVLSKDIKLSLKVAELQFSFVWQDCFMSGVEYFHQEEFSLGFKYPREGKMDKGEDEMRLTMSL